MQRLFKNTLWMTQEIRLIKAILNFYYRILQLLRKTEFDRFLAFWLRSSEEKMRIQIFPERNAFLLPPPRKAIFSP